MQNKTTARRRCNATTNPTTPSNLETTFFKATLRVVAEDAQFAVWCVSRLKKNQPPNQNSDGEIVEIVEQEMLERATQRVDLFIRNLCCLYNINTDDFPEHLEPFDIAG